MDSKISQHWEHKIEVLSEWLKSLKIIEDALERIIEYINDILTVLANV